MKPVKLRVTLHDDRYLLSTCKSETTQCHKWAVGPCPHKYLRNHTTVARSSPRVAVRYVLPHFNVDCMTHTQFYVDDTTITENIYSNKEPCNMQSSLLQLLNGATNNDMAVNSGKK